MAMFEWDDANIGHIARRGFTSAEVESAFADPRAIAVPAYTKSDELRYGVVGTTNQGRTITAFFTFRGLNIGVVTARPARRKERQSYRGSWPCTNASVA